MMKEQHMDWQKIVRAYINHVADNEGTDFLSVSYYPVVGLTEAERQALQQLSNDVWKERGNRQ
jgi:hypothetical protein